jgi:hypothetical protein
LTRGTVVGCRGDAALSSALLVAAGASEAGMWLGVAGIAHLGVQACREAGVDLARMVVVHEPPTGFGDETWGHLLAALIDGFDLVLLGAADRIRAGTARRLQSRVQSRGAVLLIAGAPGPFSCDVQVTTRSSWEGLGDGHGHLRARRVDLAVDGRRIPRTRRGSIWFPTASGEVAPATVETVPADAVALRRTG